MSNDAIDLTVCLPGTVLIVTAYDGSEWYIGITSFTKETTWLTRRLVGGVMIQSNSEEFVPTPSSPIDTVVSRFIEKNQTFHYGVDGWTLNDAERVRMVMDARTRRMLL